MDGARFANALVCAQGDAGRDDLARRRRHSHPRRDEEWRAGLRSRRVLRSRTRRRISPFSASAAARRCPRGASSARKWRPISPMGSGSSWPARQRLGRAAGRGLRETPGVRLAWPTEANEVFPDRAAGAGRGAGGRRRRLPRMELARGRARRSPRGGARRSAAGLLLRHERGRNRPPSSPSSEDTAWRSGPHDRPIHSRRKLAVIIGQA